MKKMNTQTECRSREDCVSELKWIQRNVLHRSSATAERKTEDREPPKGFVECRDHGESLVAYQPWP